MIPPCTVPPMLAFSVYVLTGVGVSARMLKCGKDRRPVGLAAYRKESYTTQGQRLLSLLLRGWVFGLPLVMLLLALAGGALCRLTR